jgi:hypothetical protein
VWGFAEVAAGSSPSEKTNVMSCHLLLWKIVNSAAAGKHPLKNGSRVEAPLLRGGFICPSSYAADGSQCTSSMTSMLVGEFEGVRRQFQAARFSF